MITRKLIIGILLSISSMGLIAQETKTGETAIMLLDRMSNIIGELEACSFTVNASQDVDTYDFGTIKKTSTSEVLFVGPDKMNIQTHGKKGHKGIWYNGDEIYFYSYDENNYAVVDAQSNIIETIEFINKDYGIEFPAADFFYPTFSDDIVENFTEIRLVGLDHINGLECYHITVNNDIMNVQFWISNDTYNLPAKYVIVYKNENNKQYEATFTNWKLNPVLPPSIFNFMPPKAATEVILIPKSK